MKIEYIPDGSPECPLIRLYGFSKSELVTLHDLIVSFAVGTEPVELGAVTGFNAIGDCVLVLDVCERNEGIIQYCPHSFRCSLDLETWADVVALIEPLIEDDNGGYQWLDRTSGISLLLSSDGQW
jgi:hypothetical protein